MEELPEKYRWKYLRLQALDVTFANENVDRLPLKEIIERLMLRKFENWVQEKTLEDKNEE